MQISENGMLTSGVGTALAVTAVPSPLAIYVFYLNREDNLAEISYVNGTWLPGIFYPLPSTSNPFCHSCLLPQGTAPY